jgi:acyl-CoA reductase-like NAD-dependent aldehyde dehydrogenase
LGNLYASWQWNKEIRKKTIERLEQAIIKEKGSITNKEKREIRANLKKASKARKQARKASQKARKQALKKELEDIFEKQKDITQKERQEDINPDKIEVLEEEEINTL